MKKHPICVGVAGTHSTGKSTFLDALQVKLTEGHLTVERVVDMAIAARASKALQAGKILFGNRSYSL